MVVHNETKAQTSAPFTTADLLRISISGVRYALLKNDMRKYANSRLAQLATWSHWNSNGHAINLPPGIHYNSSSREFYVLRSPLLFDFVLQVLSGDPLHVPSGQCPSLIRQELEFWRLSGLRFEPCCDPNRKYSCADGLCLPKVESMSRGRKPFSDTDTDSDSYSPSPFFTALRVITGVCTVISIANMIVGSLPDMQYCAPGDQSSKILRYDSSPTDLLASCKGALIFSIIDAMCVACFTLDLIVRCYDYPNKVEFLSHPLNVVDLLSVFPYWIEITLWITFADPNLPTSKNNHVILILLQLMRVTRVVRVLKLARYFKDLRVLGKTVKLAKHELGTLFLFTLVSLLAFATLLYYIERDEPDSPFTSIPASCWWSVVTITTAGYGDVTPKTATGKIAAGFACVSGILIMAMPISVLVETFGEIYTSKIWKSKKRRRESKFGRRNWLTVRGSKINHEVGSELLTLRNTF